MEDYWKALIRGMTPESKGEAHLIWIGPLLVVSLIVVLSVLT